MAALPEANEAALLAAEAPEQEPPLVLSDLGKKLREHQVPRDVCVALDTDGWTISSFRSVATSLEKFDEVLPKLLPDCVLSLLQKSQLRAAWRSLQGPDEAVPATSSKSLVPSLEASSSWSETFAPRLDASKVSTLKKAFLKNYPSEILTSATCPSLRLLSTAVHQEARKDLKWIPWKFRMTQLASDEAVMRRPSKQARLETLNLTSLLMDDPPTMEIGNNVMGISTIQRIMSVHDTALAMSGTAHLARLKHYTTKFLGFLQTRLEPDCSLRVPTVLEAQQADRVFWTNIFNLVLEKDWSVDDAIYEYSEIRAEMAALLQPRAKMPPMPKTPKGKGAGKPYVPPPPGKPPGRGKGGKPSTKGKGQGPQWIKNVTVNGAAKQLAGRAAAVRLGPPAHSSMPVLILSLTARRACPRTTVLLAIRPLRADLQHVLLPWALSSHCSFTWFAQARTPAPRVAFNGLSWS